jgi:hypothetical protein
MHTTKRAEKKMNMSAHDTGLDSRPVKGGGGGGGGGGGEGKDSEKSSV